MALSESEELELLELEEEEARAKQQSSQQQPNKQAQTNGPVQEKQSILQQIPPMLLKNLLNAGDKTLEMAKLMGNSATLGIAGEGYKQITGNEWVDKSKLTQSEQLGGQLIGSALPMNMIAKGITSMAPAMNVAQKMTQAATIGGSIGFAMPPENSFFDLQQRGKQSVIGALTAVATERATAGFNKLSDIAKGPTSEEQTYALKKIRKDFVDVKVKATDKFGGDIERYSMENPSKKVDLSDIQDGLNDEGMGYDNAFKRIVKNIPGVKTNDDGKIQLGTKTLREAQDMINYIKTKIPPNIKYQHLDLLELESDLKAAQLQAFPEMEATRAEYAKTIQPYNAVKSQFKFNRLQNSIVNGFGGVEGEQAVKDLFSNNPEALKSISSFKNAVKVTNAGRDVLWKLLKVIAVSGTGGAAVGAGYSAAKKLF